jgi:acetyltransferase-like isoleucine patch superfamily enzyme
VRGAAARARVRRYRAALTEAGEGIVFGGPHITIESGPAILGSGISIGDRCTIYDFCQLVTDDYTERCGITIGPNTHFNYGCYVCGTGGVTIGSDCLFGPGAKIIAAGHRFDDAERLIIDQGHEFREVRIGDGVWVGAGAVILPGVAVGSGAVVAAGAVVADNVPPNAVVAGVPARLLRMRGEAQRAAQEPDPISTQLEPTKQ